MNSSPKTLTSFHIVVIFPTNDQVLPFSPLPNKRPRSFPHKTLRFNSFPLQFYPDLSSTEYKTKKISLYYNDYSKILTGLKKQEDFFWLNEVNSQSLQASLKNLGQAFQNFFKKRAKYPRFHKKKNKNAFKVPQNFKVQDDFIFIPKLKTGIKFNKHRNYQRKNSAPLYIPSPFWEVFRFYRG